MKKRNKQHDHQAVALLLIMAIAVVGLVINQTDAVDQLAASVSGVTHYVAQAQPALLLMDNATGGDCAEYGTWVANLNGGGTCNLSTDLTIPVEIQADNIILNCKDITTGADHKITGSASGNGVMVDSKTGSIVESCDISNFQVGINGLNTNNMSMFENSVHENKIGIQLSNSGGTLGNHIKHNNIANNTGTGIQLISSQNTQVVLNTVSAGGTGVSLDSSTANSAFSNKILENNLGIVASNSSGNTFYDNNIRNSVNVQVDTASSNIWNTAKRTTDAGNIIGGLYLGGNYWSDYNGPDDDRDGIGDTPYVINVNNLDNYPLVLLVALPPVALTGDLTSTPMVTHDSAGNQVTSYAISSASAGGTATINNFTVSLPVGGSSATLELSADNKLLVKAENVPAGNVIQITDANNISQAELANSNDVVQLWQFNNGIYAVSPSCVSQPSGMVRWWDADSVSGTNVTDLKGIDNATLENGATTSSGYVGNAFSLDGVNDFVGVNMSNVFTPDMTIDGWVYLNNNPPNGQSVSIFGQDGPTNWNLRLNGTLSGNNFLVSEYDNGLMHQKELLGYNDAYPSPPGPWGYEMLEQGKWMHMALTWHNGEAEVYIDGKLVTKPTTPLTFEPAASGLFTTLFIGADSNSAAGDYYTSHTFPGKIDEVEVFNHVLSQSEIQSIYNAGHAGKCKPLSLSHVGFNLFNSTAKKVSNLTLDVGDAVHTNIDAQSGANNLTVDAESVDWNGLTANGFAVAGSTLNVGSVLSANLNPPDGGLLVENVGTPVINTSSVSAAANISAVLHPATGLYLNHVALNVSPADYVVAPLKGTADLTCTSSADGDKCFSGRVEFVTGGTSAVQPANVKLMNASAQETVKAGGLSSTSLFGSLTVDSQPVNNSNFVVLAPVGAQMDGNGVEIKSCGAQPLSQGTVNVLQRILQNGTQMCPGIVKEQNTVELHIIDQAKRGDCNGSGSCKLPLANAGIRVFDRNNAAFQSKYGTKNPTDSIYNQVFDNDIGEIASCTTGTDGVCTAYETKPGDYLVIVKYHDAETGKSVYTGLPKGPEDFVDTNSDGKGDFAKKDFQIIKTIKKDGTIQFSGGKKVVVSGSELDIIYPIDAVWDDGATSYVYPYIFTSADNWDVDVCSQVPQGYDIVGVYDENGNLVTDKDCYKTFVAGETKVVAFEVKLTGSPPEWAMNTKLTIKHKGKTTNLDLNVPSHVKEHKKQGNK